MGWFGGSREVGDLKEDLKEAFSKIKDDFSAAFKWVNFLKKRQEEVERNQKEIMDFTNENNKKVIDLMNDASLGNKKDKEAIIAWIDYFRAENGSIKGDISKLADYIVDLHKEMKEILEKIQELESRPNIVSEIYKEPEMPERKIEDSVKIKAPDAFVDSGDLTTSEADLMKLLYLTEKPLRYEDIAKKLGLNYGTVKNRVYKIKKKGYDLHFEMASDGEKMFFLPVHEKLKLSGR